MPSEAFKVHGFSEEFLKDKDTFDIIADDFLNLKRCNYNYNAPFDRILDGELGLLKKEKWIES